VLPLQWKDQEDIASGIWFTPEAYQAATEAAA
jgi:hypothetical protein